MRKICKRILVISLINSVILLICSSTSSAKGINIDGYFDDWEEIPSTDIYYDSSSSDQWHKGSFIIHDGYIYVCIKLAPAYRSQVPVGEYRININGKTATANIQFSDSNGNIDYSKSGELSNLKEGITENLNVFIGYWPIYNVGNAAINRADKKNQIQNDELEFSMSINQLERILNLPANSIENGAEVKISNPQLGKQSITAEGTSTGTYIGIVICVFIVFVIAIKKRNKYYESVSIN